MYDNLTKHVASYMAIVAYNLCKSDLRSSYMFIHTTYRCESTGGFFEKWVCNNTCK